MSLFYSAGLGRDAIPDSVVDNFEESLYEDQGNALSDYYSGAVQDATRQQTRVNEGSYALEITSSKARIIQDTQPSGAFSQGNTFRVDIYPDSGEDSYVSYGRENGTSASDLTAYEVQLQSKNDFDFIKFTNGSRTNIKTKTFDKSFTDEWITLEIQWKSDDTHNITVLDSNGSVIESISASDSTLDGDDIGFGLAGFGSKVTRYFDNARLM